ncbi:hypothetical protein KAI87_14165 [Myxococcota bacterium]|nr:hypothetical protein [Myxococcota bacterium]
MGKLYLSLWLLGLSFLILSTACSRQSVNIDNRPCGEGCLDGYSCNDLSGLCEKNPTGCRGDDCSEPCDGDLCDCLFTEGGMEICDGLDNDCDGETDNEARDCENYYADTDGDSLGDENDYQCLCAGAAPYTIAEDPDCTTNCFDCDDSSDLCGSNCSDLDSDNIPDCRDTCISLSGDGYGEGPGCLGALCDVGGNEEPCKLYYRDTDEDTWGDKEDFLCLCAPEGEHNILVDSTCTSQECFDCNDNDFACKNDCSDLDGDDVMDCEDSCMDYDHDDYGEGLGCVDTDCNDNISTINICTDYYADRDGDGYRSTTEVQCLCAADSDYIYQGSTQVDCDDSKATSYAGATETCDGVNNDCSTPIPQNEADSDSDGWIG